MKRFAAAMEPAPTSGCATAILDGMVGPLLAGTENWQQRGAGIARMDCQIVIFSCRLDPPSAWSATSGARAAIPELTSAAKGEQEMAYACATMVGVATTVSDVQKASSPHLKRSLLLARPFVRRL